MLEVVGRFHPVFVHLPIGFLLLAAIFQILLSWKEQYLALKLAIGVSLFFGTISAVVACLTGYILSSREAYDEGLIVSHKWLGISTLVVSAIALYLHHKDKSITKYVLYIMAILLLITGHQGGSLTHGEDFLYAPLLSESTEVEPRKSIENVQEANAFEDVIQPIIKAKCVTCHRQDKKKGGLMMIDHASLLAGGKNGAILLAGSSEKSKMITRMLLPLSHNDHMPPKGKPQPTEEEINLIKWWIDGGADFQKKVKDIPQSDVIRKTLAKLENTTEEVILPIVDAAPIEAIKSLTDKNIAVVPISSQSNLLSVNLIAADTVTANELAMLDKIKNQLYTLRLGNAKYDKSALKSISSFPKLTELYLDQANLLDEDLKIITSPTVAYLNLVNNNLSASAITQLKFPSLKELYLYGNAIDTSDIVKIKGVFPKAKINFGGYIVPTLLTDTSMIKY